MYHSSSPSSGRSSTSSAGSSTPSNRSSISTRAAVRACPKFKLEELAKATNNFDDSKIIVRGDFAITYEGFLDDGNTVAVKRYDIDENIADEYRNEIEKLSKYHHTHLVSLIGKCEDSQELILVQEFMKYGTLADHLFGEGVPLSWEQRLGICIGAARGLEYLHNGIGNTKRIIHRNVNPANILLDENMTAKLSEFGYAKLGNANTLNSAMQTDVKGTDKYLDTHYKLTGQLTRRADIYAFGVVLFDVLFGRMDFKKGIDKKQEKLSEWTQKCLKDGSLDGTIDEYLKGQISTECLKSFCDLASKCLDDNPLNRPTMTAVVESLVFILETSRKTRP